MLDVSIIGGGAAGFFAAINIKEKHPNWKVEIFEKSPSCLGKVKVSGGGRCNVTHNCFDPILLCNFYPRGGRELLSVFNRFNPKSTIDWFAAKGVQIKAEPDGRMFPVTDDSQTIIDCFYEACSKHSIKIHVKSGVKSVVRTENNFEFEVDAVKCRSRNIVVATGSSEFFWKILKDLGHQIVHPVPSLFTFNIQHPIIDGLMGLSVAKAKIKLLADKATMQSMRLKESMLIQEGPMLITHWGLSGPSVLKLSSVAARLLNQLNYKFEIQINLSGLNTELTQAELIKHKNDNGRKLILNTSLYGIPSRLWYKIVEFSFGSADVIWADSSKKDLMTLAVNLSALNLQVNGKSTFKEEFVTAGGVDLKEIDFRTMESKLVKGLYMAGEVLNIDALTGGFNFQAAWSEAWIISQSVQ